MQGDAVPLSIASIPVTLLSIVYDSLETPPSQEPPAFFVARDQPRSDRIPLFASVSARRSFNVNFVAQLVSLSVPALMALSLHITRSN